jgi:hypothetical protein
MAVGYSQLYRGIQGFSSTGGGSETPKLKELKPSFQHYRGLISAVLGPLGPRITIYIGTSHRRSNEPSLKYNNGPQKFRRRYSPSFIAWKLRSSCILTMSLIASSSIALSSKSSAISMSVNPWDSSASLLSLNFWGHRNEPICSARKGGLVDILN